MPCFFHPVAICKIYILKKYVTWVKPLQYVINFFFFCGGGNNFFRLSGIESANTMRIEFCGKGDNKKVMNEC